MPGGRTQLRTPGLGQAASRFSPPLPDPRGIQLLEAEREALLHPQNVPWAELLVLAGRASLHLGPSGGPEAV